MGVNFGEELWKEIEKSYHSKEKGQICNPGDAQMKII